ncbi:ABC transporter permease [Variovorax dokdonensis]|uniref:ABC transporter permease n=1 Tax=Variovorax dokdonensis TaxID=344883 RepID=A0ABT7NHD0_9BURK|nr:ABC transporter permease [Variovorax dokdonensis]MDM0047317.1 ABC transporter permease [Variovorax dokdonensis]
MSGVGPRPRTRNAFVVALGREIAWLARSPWDLALLTIAPLLTLVVLGAMFIQGSARDLPIAVVDADHSPISRQLVRNLRASAQVQVVAEPDQLEQAWTMARQTKVWAVVLIPEGLQRDVLAGRQGQISLYQNASFYSVGALAGRGVDAAVSALQQQVLPELARAHNVPAALRVQVPRIQATMLFNPQLSYEWFLEALLQPGILHVLLSCAVAVAMGRAMKADGQAAGRGFGANTLALAGMLAPYVVAFTAWQMAGTAWLCGWRGWGVHGSLAMLLAGQVALYACYAAIAAVVALLLRDTYTTLSAVALYGGPAMTFSDATLPVLGAPVFTQVWSQVLPFSHYVRLQMEQMFMGAPAADSLPSLGVLVGVALGMFVLAAGLLCRRPVGATGPAPSSAGEPS